MAKDDDMIENLDEQLKKLEENNRHRSDADNSKMATGRRMQKGRHEHIKKIEQLDGTKEFKGFDATDTKIFDANEVRDEAIISDETTKVNLAAVEESVDDDLEKTKENKSTVVVNEGNEMSNTFVDKSPFGDIVNKKMKKEVKIIIALIIGVILIIGSIIGILIFTDKEEVKKDKVVVEKELTEKQKEKLIGKYGTDLEKVISEELETNKVLLKYEEAVKLVKSKEKIKCHENKVYEDGTIYLNKCSINGIMTKYSYGEVKDIVSNKLKVYVEMNSGKATLNKPSASKENLYNVYEVDCGEQYTEAYLLDDYVVYYDANGLVQMKNFKDNTKVLSNLNYKEVVPIKFKNNTYDKTYVAVLVGNFFGIYKLTGEQVVSPMYSDIVADVNKKVTKRNSISIISNNLIVVSDGKNYGVIDYTNNKIIVPLDFKKIALNDNYLLATDHNDKGSLYDFTGKKYFENNKVYGNAGEKYFLIEEDGMIKLSTIDGKIIHDYGIINNIGSFYSSKVQEKNIIFQVLDTNTNGRCIEFIYDLNDNTGLYTEDKMCGIN